MIKKFEIFVNEGLRDLMKPKSISEVERDLNKLSVKKLKERFVDLFMGDEFNTEYERLHSFSDFIYFIENVINRNLINELEDYLRLRYDEYEIDIEYVLDDIYEYELIDGADLSKEELIKLIITLASDIEEIKNMI